MPSPCVIDRTPVFDTVTAPVVVFTPIPVPAVIDVTPEFGTFIMRDPSPTNLSAVIDDAVICCDDKKEAKTDPELIFRDEIVAKLLRYPNEPRPFVVLVKSVTDRPPPPPASPLIVISFAFELKVILVPATRIVEL